MIRKMKLKVVNGITFPNLYSYKICTLKRKKITMISINRTLSPLYHIWLVSTSNLVDIELFLLMMIYLTCFLMNKNCRQ